MDFTVGTLLLSLLKPGCHVVSCSVERPAWPGAGEASGQQPERPVRLVKCRGFWEADAPFH